MKKRIVCMFLCMGILISMLSGCGSKTKKSTSSSNSKYDKFITVDVFDDFANYQGIQSGWFGKIVKDKFNMELNIIAPNVAGGGDTLFQTRSSAGNLGDLVITKTKNGRLKDIVSAGLLTDMTDLLKDKDVLKNYQKAIDTADKLADKKGIWAIPGQISNQSASTPSEGLDLTFGPYLRWDLYKKAGYPKIKTLEDILPVLDKLQKEEPKSDNGKKPYAISLFKDWDDNMMNNAKQPTCFYGYDEMGFVLAKADGSDFQSIIDSDSMYTRVLKLFFKANQMGLVDPESTTQNFDTLGTKYQNGQVLYAPWPWLGQSKYNTDDRKKQGKGFMLVPIDDMKIFSFGCCPEGNTQSGITIGSKAKDTKRLADFIDWLYSPEGVEINGQANGACGPKGLTWELKDGKAKLTAFGKKALPSADVQVPKEWGSGSFKDGLSALNFKTVNLTDKDPNIGEAYNYQTWESYLADNTTDLDKDWQKQMNAKTTLDYLKNAKQILVAPGTSYVQPEETSNVATLRSQCKASIVEYSWKMIFAKDEKEFNSLLKQMQDKVKGLGYAEVLKVDMKNSKDQDKLRNAAKK